MVADQFNVDLFYLKEQYKKKKTFNMKGMEEWWLQKQKVGGSIPAFPTTLKCLCAKNP